jgi:hypothetical protein
MWKAKFEKVNYPQEYIRLPDLGDLRDTIRTLRKRGDG